MKNKETEAKQLRLKLQENHVNQQSDVTLMIEAIQGDLINYNDDLKNFDSDVEKLKSSEVLSCLVKGQKTNLIDYIDLEDLEYSKSSLESRKESLKVKVGKLNDNKRTLKSVIGSLNSDFEAESKRNEVILKEIHSISDELEKTGEITGINVFNNKSDLKVKKDFDWSKANQEELQLYDECSKIKNTVESELDKLIGKAKSLFIEYTENLKKSFSKITTINTALRKNESERIKTLKMYEMFKKDYRFFQTPKYLPQCYSEALYEMKRRYKFK